MQTDFIKLYIEANQLLIRSIVIKLKRNIDSTNDYLKALYGESIVDPHKPSTWKYYMNLAGDYHSTDQTMEVTSLDTLEKITFSKAVLIDHPATLEAYKYGSRYYNSLLALYPDQEDLIMGILYPVDLKTAIDAPDGAILRYRKDLVEPQEISLIHDLEEYIKMYIERWDVQAFGVSDTLYNAAQYALMILNTLPKLLNLRLHRCKTPEAHSFHIRMYLASHGRLDRYMPYMTLKQCLWLYRNLLYIEHNNGKVEQFKTLIDKLLTDRYIPIGDISIRQLNLYDELYYTQVQARRKAINTQYNVPEKDYYSIEKLYRKEIPLAPGNRLYYETNVDKVSHKLKTTTASVLQSKNLESAMVDYSDAIPDPIEAVLLREWGSQASKGLYTAVVSFKDSHSPEAYTLYAYDAFIYMWYVFMRAVGYDKPKLLPFINLKSRKVELPSTDKMLSIVEPVFTDLPSIANDLISKQPNIKPSASNRAFYNTGQKIFQESYRHWFLVSNTEHLYKRALVENMVLSMFEDTHIEFPADTEDMDKWLSDRNLPSYDYTYEEAQQLIYNIFTASTGYMEDPNASLSNIHKAMIAILQQLSSYSIQIIQDLSMSNIRPLNWSAIRIGDMSIAVSEILSLCHRVSVLDYDSTVECTSILTTDTPNKTYLHLSSLESNTVHITTDVYIETPGSGHQAYNIHIPSSFIEVRYPEYDVEISKRAKFIGMEHYLGYTPEQISLIKTIY